MVVLIVRGTKKLRDRLRGAPQAGDRESTTQLGDWFANALFWKPQVALFVNSRTMVPVFVPLAPAATLLDRAPAAIADILRRHGVPDQILTAELEAMGDTAIAPTDDRQLVGVMNEFAFQAENIRARTPAIDLAELSMRLSQLLVGPLQHRHGTPAGELQALVGGAAATVPRQVHRLKVTLLDTEPPIWRRVVVAGDRTLPHLHDVIQAAFGWTDSHLHDFEIAGERYTTPFPDDWMPVQDERDVRVDRIAEAGGAWYTYDFGDSWVHDIAVEDTIAADDATVVPACTGGERACPPEDCGGVWGYAELVAILADPSHPEHAERVEWLEWIGRDGYDPEAFSTSEFASNLVRLRAYRFGG